MVAVAVDVVVAVDVAVAVVSRFELSIHFRTQYEVPSTLKHFITFDFEHLTDKLFAVCSFFGVRRVIDFALARACFTRFYFVPLF